MFDLPYPFEKYDQLFVPGVQRRGDGERRGGDLPGDLRLPLEGARGDRRAPGADDPARAGPHVVRRPGHDALVERPLAQRVVRRVGQHRRARPRRPAGRGPGRRSAPPRSPGPTARTSCGTTHPIVADIRDLEDVEVNFDGITYAKGASVLKQLVAYVGREEFVQGLRATSRRTPGATPSWPTCCASWRSPAGATWPRGARDWLQQAGVNTLRPVVEVDADGVITARRRRADRTGRPPACCARTGWPSAPTTCRTAGWCAPAGSSWTSAARGPTVTELVGGRGRTCCWSTTTTWPTRRSGSTTHSLATAVDAPGRLRRPRCPAR